MAQMSLFSRTEIAGMRDWTAARNHCPERDAFRREHEQHRAWGLRRRHAAKLRHIQDSRSTPPTAPAGRNDQTRPTSPTPPDPHPAGTLPANCDLTGYGYPNPTSTSTILAGSGPAGGSLAGSGPAGGSLAGCGSTSSNPASAVPQRQPRRCGSPAATPRDAARAFPGLGAGSRTPASWRTPLTAGPAHPPRTPLPKPPAATIQTHPAPGQATHAPERPSAQPSRILWSPGAVVTVTPGHRPTPPGCAGLTMLWSGSTNPTNALAPARYPPARHTR
jgi:hypothetical protein